MPRDTRATISFGNLISPDLDLGLYLVGIWPILICFLRCPLGSPLTKFAFEGVIIPVSVVDNAKSDDFNPWPDLDLAFGLVKFFIYSKSPR